MLADVWHEILPDLPQPDRPLAKTVSKAIGTALRRDPSLEVWRSRFERIRRSSFLTGKSTDFVAKLIWALGSKNIAKLEGGLYDDRVDGGPARRRGGRLGDADAALEQVKREFHKDSDAGAEAVPW